MKFVWVVEGEERWSSNWIEEVYAFEEDAGKEALRLSRLYPVAESGISYYIKKYKVQGGD